MCLTIQPLVEIVDKELRYNLKYIQSVEVSVDIVETVDEVSVDC